MIKEEYKNGCRLKEQVKYNIDYDDCQILNLTCANYIATTPFRRAFLGEATKVSDDCYRDEKVFVSKCDKNLCTGRNEAEPSCTTHNQENLK